jgi:hypothetical protein
MQMIAPFGRIRTGNDQGKTLANYKLFKPLAEKGSGRLTFNIGFCDEDESNLALLDDTGIPDTEMTLLDDIEIVTAKPEKKERTGPQEIQVTILKDNYAATFLNGLHPARCNCRVQVRRTR